MPRHLILLTGEFDASELINYFSRITPSCSVTWVRTADELAVAVAANSSGETRLVSFCSGVIVSAAILGQLRCGGYNVHPGPPNYPGRHPECWGVYHGATRFGATFHHMTPRVDEGVIVDTRGFEVPPESGQRQLAEAAFKAALELLLAWAERIVRDDHRFPGNGEVWHGRKWRRADLVAICRMPADIGPVEFERRRRAFAELPNCSLTVTLHGRDFVYTVPPD